MGSHSEIVIASLRRAQDTLLINGFETDALLVTEAANAYLALRAALAEIAKGEGEFSRNPLQHAENTIESMKLLAREALGDMA